MKNFEKYKTVQDIARSTISHLEDFVIEGVTEEEIANEAERFMREKGVKSFWYYDVAAFVLVGVRTTLSLSGRDYEPSAIKVRASDLVTIDLSPEIDGCWGDFARSIIVGSDKELDRGLEIEKKLHRKLVEYISSDKTFDDVYRELNDEIDRLGFENLDFKGNLGHTIEKHRDDRRYIEAGNGLPFSEVELFTFEPHIREKGGEFGFKMENIYYFKDGVLKEL